MSPTVEIFSLDNGLRVVCRKSAADVDYCGVVVNAGSRDESPSTFGLAHFVEHTIFKGTLRRRSCHIINRMEAVGGELNAYTTKEETVIYSIFPHGHLGRAAQLIADLLINSQFPTAEIEREREVVASEIDSYLDAPADAIYDDFDDIIFAGTPLGHNILGPIENVNAFTSESCRSFVNSFYKPENIVFFYYGNSRPKDVARIVERHFSVMKSASQSVVRQQIVINRGSIINSVRNIDSHQAHTILGAIIPGMHDSMRHAVSLMVNILGGPGMNSKLNVALRENRGLVYTVEASSVLFSDVGMTTIYYGCDHADVNRCRRLINNQIRRLIDTPLTQRQLDNARRQYLGQLTVASDNAAELAISTGRSLLNYGKVASPEEIIGCYNAITPADIQQAASLLNPDSLSSLSFI